MASLVAPLACGVVGATSGSATFFNEGTGTPATVYSDPEGVTVVTSHTLDSNGGIVRYVNNRVDVVVKDAAAATVRTFTWGTDARETRVENAGFTGTLAGGGTAAGGRTTVDAVLSSLYSSLGAIDGKVLVNGVGVNLQTALSGLSGIVFNVKSYGAVGNGSTDDRASIIAAIAAAITAGGGTIFFPPGTYKILGQITVPTNSKLSFLGASATAVRIVQHTTATNGWFLMGADFVSFANITFDRNAVGMSGRVLQTSGTLNVINCTFAGFNGCHIYADTVDTTDVNCFGCTFTQNEGSAEAIGAFATCTANYSRIRFVDCSFYNSSTANEMFLSDGVTGNFYAFDGCYFLVSTPAPISVVTDGFANFSACQLRFTNAGAGTFVIGQNACVLNMTGNYVSLVGAADLELGGIVSEAGNFFSVVSNTIVYGSQRWLSQHRDHANATATVATASGTYTPSQAAQNHFVTYAGTNVGTLTLASPGAGNPGDRLEIAIYHSGASGPSALAWNAAYSTTQSAGVGPAITASIAMGAVLRFSFRANAFGLWVQAG